jgi:hypothetical protein
MTILTIPRPLRDKLGEEATDAFIEVIRNVDFESKRDLATKFDIQDVKAEIQLVRSELKADIQLVKTELDGKIDKVKTELDAKIDKLDNKIDKVKTELISEIRMNKFESKLYFLILLLAIFLTNPSALGLIAKILGIVK